MIDLEKFKNDASEALQSLETLVSSTFEAKKNIIDSATLDIVELVSNIADKICHQKFDNKSVVIIEKENEILKGASLAN